MGVHIDQAWYDESTSCIDNVVSTGIDMGSKTYYPAVRDRDIHNLVAPGRGIEKAPVLYQQPLTHHAPQRLTAPSTA
jgi:hypothetical protein